MEKISVIVPIYNSEANLERCLESILSQSYENIEIIAVNDGSTDDSLKVLNRYGENYSNIRIINQNNQGQSAARNRGIEIATGDYIGFVDSDDIIHDKMYEYLHEILVKSNSDISAIQIQVVNNKFEMEYEINDDESIEIVENNQLLTHYMHAGLNKPAGQYSAGRKLFKKRVLKKVRFLEGHIYEDMLFNYEALENAKRLANSNNKMYYYFQDMPSTMRSNFSQKDLDLILISDIILQKAIKTDNKRLIELSKMKKGRSYYTLLGKLLHSDNNIETQKLSEIKGKLVDGLRRNYKNLIKSSLPLKAKVSISGYAVNYDFVTKLSKKIRKK